MLNNRSRTTRACLVLAAACVTGRMGLAQQTSAPVILQWFESSWSNIEHRTPDLFNAGYGALWTPPPGRAIYLPQGGGIGYDVYDRFDLGTARDPTLYGTQSSYISAVRETQKFGGSVFVDYVHHHVGSLDVQLNGYTYPSSLTSQNAPYLQDRSDYPGFELSDPNNNVSSPYHRDTYAALYGANAGQAPTGNVYEYWFRLGENLVTIDLASDRAFVRNPVPGEANNIRQSAAAWAIPTATLLPSGKVGADTTVRQANTPTEANRALYPDLQSPARTVTDNGVTYTVHDYNLANPSAGDPTAETNAGYMMRYAQWLTQVVGVDGLRIDAARHVPLGEYNSGYNPDALDVPKLVDRAVAGASSRYNLDGTQRSVFQFQEVFSYNASQLASFVRKSQPAGDTVNPNRDVLDFSLWAAMAQNMSGNGAQNDWFNIRSASVNATIQNTLNANIANNGANGIGFVYNHDEGVTPPGSGGTIALDNVAHAFVLMRPGNAYVYYRSNEFDRSDNPLFFLKQGRSDAMGGVNGDILTTLVDARNSYGRGDFVQRYIDNEGSNGERLAASAIYVFERQGSALVGLNVGYNPGATSRTVGTSFQAGQWLEEVTGNWQDASGQVRRYTVVNGDGTATIDIPWNNTQNGNKGYAIYGLPKPRGTLSVSGATQTLDETPTAGTNGTARISDIDVITGNSFDITLATSAVTLVNGSNSFRDIWADGNAARLKINDGFDANGNGSADHPDSAASNATRYGFEEFLTTNSPGFSNGGNGLYKQTVNAAALGEGYHYLTARAWRAARAGESEVFTDFRKVIYVDRLKPESGMNSTAQFGSADTTRDFQIKSLDSTANSVHVLLNLPAALTDAQILAMIGSGNKAEQIDRDLFGYVANGVVDGNYTATVVTYEITGNFNIQRFAGLRQVTSQGLGFGDIDADNVFEPSDITLFEAIFLSDNTLFAPTADLTGDGLVNLLDLTSLGASLQAGGADSATLAAYDTLYATYVPEPASLTLTGLAGMLLRRRRRAIRAA